MAKPYFTRRRRISLKKAHIVLVDKCVLFSGGEREILADDALRLTAPRMLTHPRFRFSLVLLQKQKTVLSDCLLFLP